MSGILWNVWTYCNRLITYYVYDNTVCVKNNLLASTTFNLGSNPKYPITKYCTYCGHERFSEKQISLLINPTTVYNNIISDNVASKCIHPLICSDNNCKLGLFNLSVTQIIAYDLDDILGHTDCGSFSTIDEILEKFETKSIDQSLHK